MFIFRTFLVFILLVSFYFQIGANAIRCWSCNSESFSRCGDPFNSTENSPRLRPLLIDCETQSFTNIQRSLHNMRWVCKKSQLKSPHGRTITIRGCHYMSLNEPTGDCISQVVQSSHIETEFCETCDEHSCNSAWSVLFRTNFFLMGFSSFLFFFLLA